MALGVTVTPRSAPPAVGGPTTTDTVFYAGAATQGPTDKATRLRSLADFTPVYGARAAGNLAAFDWFDNFFREGGRQAYMGRYTNVGTVDSGLALFTEDLGAGQVVAPEETPGAVIYGKLLTHAFNFRRHALLDYANGDTLTAMTTAAGTFRGAANNDWGQLAGQWVNIPAPAGVIGGTARQVPGSATVAALIARADSLGNPNRAAAGRDFPLQYATSFTRDLTMTDVEGLLTAGGNAFVNRYGVLQSYGFQTGVAQSPDTPFWQASASRTRMWMIAWAKAIGENYMFKPIDGRGHLASDLQRNLNSKWLELWSNDGLYGDTPEEAFATSVGASVNQESTIALGELHAVVEARLSMYAKSIPIDLVSIPVTGRVSTAA
jgi:hypothetical protein